MFAVCALAEIGNAKNNLIGVGEVCKHYFLLVLSVVKMG